MSDETAYVDMTVDELRDAVESIDDVEELELIRELEQDNKDRVTAINAIDDRLEELDWDGESREDELEEQLDDTADDLDEDEDDEEEEDDVETGHDAFKEARSANRQNERITVKNPLGRSITIAHNQFDAYEAKQVENTKQVREALRRGRLQFVRNR